MSNTRIRYKKIGPELLKSVRVFNVEGMALSVTLNTEEKRYMIVDENAGEEITNGGKTKNLAVLKIQAKKALTELGVNFGEESRNRGTTTDTETTVRPTNSESSEIPIIGSL